MKNKKMTKILAGLSIASLIASSASIAHAGGDSSCGSKKNVFQGAYDAFSGKSSCGKGSCGSKKDNSKMGVSPTNAMRDTGREGTEIEAKGSCGKGSCSK